MVGFAAMAAMKFIKKAAKAPVRELLIYSRLNKSAIS